MKFEPKMLNIGAKMSQNRGLEASWGLWGGLWGPCGSAGASRCSKPASRDTARGPLGIPFLVIFLCLRVFFEGLLLSLFLNGFGGPFFMILGVEMESLFISLWSVFGLC